MRFVFAAIITLLLAVDARTETTRETLEAFGFFGLWARHCGTPASPSNNERRAFVSAGGEAMFTEGLGRDAEPNVYLIRQAERLQSDRIRLRIELNGHQEQELIMRRAKNRIRTISNQNMPSGASLVSDGVVISTGRKTPWLRRCAKES